MTRQDMQRILDEDAKRRNARIEAEDSLLMQSGYVPEGVDPYHFSRSIKGEPSNHHRVVRATSDNWDNHYYRDAHGNLRSKRTRCVGTDVTVTYADGTTEVRSPGSFRAESTHTKQRKHATQVRQIGAAQTYEARVAQLGAVGDID